MTKKSLKAVEAASVTEQILDQEWVRLIRMAREHGMTVEEVRQFFAEAAASNQYDEGESG